MRANAIGEYTPGKSYNVLCSRESSHPRACVREMTSFCLVLVSLSSYESNSAYYKSYRAVHQALALILHISFRLFGQPRLPWQYTLTHALVSNTSHPLFALSQKGYVPYMDIMFPYSALMGTPLPLAQAQHLFHLTQFHPTFHVPHGYLHAYQHVAAPLAMGFGRPQVSLSILSAQAACGVGWGGGEKGSGGRAREGGNQGERRTKYCHGDNLHKVRAEDPRWPDDPTGADLKGQHDYAQPHISPPARIPLVHTYYHSPIAGISLTLRAGVGNGS